MNPNENLNVQVGQRKGQHQDNTILDYKTVSFSQTTLSGFIQEHGQNKLDSKVQLVLKSKYPLLLQGYIENGNTFYTLKVERSWTDKGEQLLNVADKQIIQVDYLDEAKVQFKNKNKNKNKQKTKNKK